MEVYYNGEWGRVCRWSWSSTNAGVLCRQMGFGSYGSSVYFGQGLGPIWLRSVICTGSESALAECGHLGVNITVNCHQPDAGVRCHGTQGMLLFCDHNTDTV